MHLSSWKYWGLSLAVVSLAGVGIARAQSLAGVTTTLDHTLESKSARVGEPVTATLRESVKRDGLNLPRGTELVGKVAAVNAAQNGGQSSLSLLFTTAKLKDGKEVPVKATIIAAFPRSVNDSGDGSGATLGEPPQQVPSDGVFDQEPGALSHVTMTSAVKNDESATFTSSREFKLQAGTFLQLGVGAAGASSTGASAAE
ncbi:MAG TPA: hypothetical protein VHU89_15800 [Acidobacteriaceae bacterium]|jgi:hypothetical protein|nr:hypothetical protein [Acidobacteriaceae bacterium]